MKIPLKIQVLRSAISMCHMRNAGLSLALAAGFCGVTWAEQPPGTAASGVSYDKDILPLLQQHKCIQCHGPRRQKAKLRLDTLNATLKGGENGEILVKGQSAKSDLVARLARVDQEKAMPPKGVGKPMTPEEIALIRAWIDEGAR